MNHNNSLETMREKMRAYYDFFSEYLAPSKPIFERVNVLSFEKFPIQRILLVMFKYLYRNIPISASQPV